MALSREQMAQRVDRELQDGYYVNLGIGIPTLVANYVPEGMEVMLQSENGLLGMGAFPTEEELDLALEKNILWDPTLHMWEDNLVRCERRRRHPDRRDPGGAGRWIRVRPGRAG